MTKAGECGIKGFNVGNALDKLQKLRNSLRAYLTPQPGQEPLESESAKATKALEATKDAAKQARLLYDLAPPDTKVSPHATRSRQRWSLSVMRLLCQGGPWGGGCIHSSAAS